jgi:putative ABC transport system substrate-binding protein
MHRRALVGGLVVGILAGRRSTLAQPATKTFRVGGLIPSTAAGFSTRVAALREGFRDFGYVEGNNLVLELRFADDRYDRLPALAAELVALRVDVIVTASHPAALATKNATSIIPIVVAFVGDPVVTGLVASYARPGGNLTAISFHFPDLMAKRIEILREALPQLRRVGVLRNPRNQAAATVLAAMEERARALKIELHLVDVREPAELDAAFSDMAKRADAVVVVDDAMISGNARLVADMAIKHRLPMIGLRTIADAGGLLSYGPDVAACFRQSVALIDKILKGAKPADLPIQQAERLEFVVNIRTAKALGLTIPQSVLLRADEVIQ